MNRNSTINKIIAVILAILLWAYVVIVVNPPSTAVVRAVPVQLLNADKLEKANLAIAGDGVYTVDVILSGTRLDVTGVEEGSVTATADLSNLTPGQNYITVKVNAPESTTIQEIRTERIQIYVDELVSVDKEVQLNIKNMPEDMELGALVLSNSSIPVTGAKILVDAVKYMVAELDAALLVEDVVKSLDLNIKPVNSDGAVVGGVSPATGKIKLTGALYNVSSVPLYTKVEGVPGLGAALEKSSIPSEVYIKGSLEALSRTAHIEAEPINIEGITKNLNIELMPILPKGIELSERNPSLVASFVLSDEGMVSFYYDKHSIEVVNLDPNLVATVQIEGGQLRADVSAAIELVEFIDASDFVFEIDMTGLSEPGSYELEIIGHALSEEEFEILLEPSTALVIVEEIDAPVENPE